MPLNVGFRGWTMPVKRLDKNPAPQTSPRFAGALRRDTVQFGAVMAIPEDEMMESNRQIKAIAARLATALQAGPIRKIDVPDKQAYLESKGITFWNAATRDRLLKATTLVQVGEDPENVYLILRPAGKPSPVFTVYGLKDNLRLAAAIRSNNISDSLDVYFDVSAADTPQTGGVGEGGYWQPPVAYNSIDPAVFDETRAVRKILEKNRL